MVCTSLPLSWLSLLVSARIGSVAAVPACSAHPKCVGLDGDCCPAMSGVTLDCCARGHAAPTPKAPSTPAPTTQAPAPVPGINRPPAPAPRTDVGTHVTLSAVPYLAGSKSVEYPIRRIEWQTVSVDDIGKAGLFYKDILGGAEVPFCASASSKWCTPEGYVRIYGDDHHAATFFHDTATVPDISSKGEYEMLSRFFVFSNGAIQLVSFVRRDANDQVFKQRRHYTSSAIIGNAHMCLQTSEGVDTNRFIQEVESKSAAMGIPDVKFNRPIGPYRQANFSDRAKIPESEYANCFQGGIWEGLCATYFKGPNGEPLEIATITRTLGMALARSTCSRGGALRQLVQTSKCKGGYCDSLSKDKLKPLTQQMEGMFQYGLRTTDFSKSVGFYSEVLGGDLVSFPAAGNMQHVDDVFMQIFGNETFEAWAYAAEHGITREEAMRLYNIPDLTSQGTARVDLRFIMYDNYVVEVIEYTDGLTYGGDGFDPKNADSSSLSYAGSIAASFGVDRSIPIGNYLELVKKRLKSRGYSSSVKLPKALAGFPADHPYHGLGYGYGKGPDGEAIAFVEILGNFEETLKQTFISSGAVSTLFNETNAFAIGDMDPICRFVNDVPVYNAYDIAVANDLVV